MPEPRIAIIGGTGLDQLPTFNVKRTHAVQTSYGVPSNVITEGTLFGKPIFFLPRHGASHSIPPHRINYRANIDALHKLGINTILSITAVGGIADEAAPRTLIVPDQIIDYTYGREHTFFDGVDGIVQHIDFTEPFCPRLRNGLLDAARHADLPIIDGGVYGATQGPRLETAAEIGRMANDGCTVVGMTAMPEAALAREAEIDYVNCSVVVNWAAGIVDGVISMSEIEEHLEVAMGDLQRLLKTWLTRPGPY